MLDLNNYKVIGFDLDNTLFDQILYEFEIFKEISTVVENYYNIANNKYFDAIKELYLSGIKSNTFDKAMLICNKELPLDWEEYVQKEILPIYREFIPMNLKLFNKSLEILKYFKKLNKKLVLITNGRVKAQNIKIDKLNIRKYFDLILISDIYTIPKRKPNTFMFEQSLEFFNIDSKEMVYIGDDLVLDKSCENIGIKFIDIKKFNFLFLNI